MPRKLYTCFGKSQTMTEWAREYGLTAQIITNRINHGWELDKAISTPVNRLKSVTYKGKTYRSIQRFCDVHGYCASTISKYLKEGKTLEETVDIYRAKTLYMGGIHCGHNDCFTCPYADCVEPT